MSKACLKRALLVACLGLIAVAPGPAGAIGLNIQHETDLHLLESLAEQGQPTAQARLALSLRTGYGIAVDPARARHLLALALAAGNPLAQVLSCQDAGGQNLALCEQAADSLKLLAAGDAYARYGLGVYYRLRGEGETAQNWLQQSTDELPLAWVELGRLHEAGALIEENNALEASACYRAAAEQNIAEGMYELGRLLIEGIDETDHSAEGRHWLEQAALRGHPGAAAALQ
jgi:TPR repeat protein